MIPTPPSADPAVPLKRRRAAVVAMLLLGLVGWMGMEARAVTVQVTVNHQILGKTCDGSAVEWTNAAAQRIAVSRLDYLLSEFVLIGSDGVERSLGKQTAFVSATSGRTTFELKSVPSQTYSGLRFRVGLPPESNHADPASIAAGDPLHPLVNGLHWNWRGGYVFLALEGAWTEPGADRRGFSHHLATDAIRMNVGLSGPLDFRTDASVTMRFAVERCFDQPQGISLSDDTTSTHSRAGDGVAERLRDAVVGAFALDPPVGSLRVTKTPGKPGAEKRFVEVGASTTPFRFKMSGLFPRPALPLDNPLTEEGVALGERLFEEPRLSGNDRQSCAGCHQRSAGFADAGRPVSAGTNGRNGTRNAMALVNLAWSSVFFWDGRAASLREQVLQPIENPGEMNGNLPAALEKLKAAGYGDAFNRAFGKGEITADRVARALEQYLLVQVSYGSRFDAAMNGTARFTGEEQRGFELFNTERDPRRGQFGADCFHCHGGALFTDFQFHNNGLAAANGSADAGRSVITGRSADAFKFKTPSLRNVEVTGPYMHDGRFQTLEEVVAHYSSGVKGGATLDPNLARHPEGGLQLSADDQRALVAFLKTLTDPRYASSARGVSEGRNDPGTGGAPVQTAGLNCDPRN